MSDSLELKGVEETLMIPLWARAMATRRRGLIDDPAAVDLVERLGYDFESKLGHARSMMPMAEVRATRFDEQDVLVQGVLPPGPAGLYRPVTGRLSTSLDDSPAGSAVSG